MDDKEQVKFISSLDFDISKVNDTMKNLNSIFEKNMQELEKKVKNSTDNINKLISGIGGININVGGGIGNPQQAAKEINKNLANVMTNAVKHLNTFLDKVGKETSEQQMAHEIKKDVENIDKEIAKFVRRSINLATSDIREELQRVPVWARSKGGGKLDDIANEALSKFPALEGYGGNTPSEMLLNFFDTYKAYNTTKKQLLEDMNKTTQTLAKAKDYAGKSINDITNELTKSLESMLDPKELEKFKGLSFEGKRDYLVNLLQKYKMSIEGIADESTQRLVQLIDTITGQTQLTPTKSDQVKQVVNNLNTAQENLQKRIVKIIDNDIKSITEVFREDKLDKLSITKYFDKDGDIYKTAETHTADRAKLQTDAYKDLLNLTKQLIDLENKRTGASEKQLQVIKAIETSIEEQMADVYKIIDAYGLEDAELEKNLQMETRKLGNANLLKKIKKEELDLETKRIAMENALPKMEKTAATIQQTIRTKELSAEFSKQAGILREQINLTQERLTKEGRLTNEEVEQTAELQKQLDILRQQVGTAAADKPLQPTVRESPFMARTQTALSYGMIYKGIQAMKEAITTISDVEMGITEIARVTEDAAFNFDKVRDKVIQLGIDYGQTFDNVQDIALRWAQAGYNISDTLELTKTSLLALNTAELDAQNATESLIGIMAQWNLTAQDLPLVLDKINKVGDDFTVTSQDLVDGLLRSSGAAKIMGLSLEQTIALLTTMREASGRTGQEVGNALNSILSYIQRAGSIKVIESMGIKMFADEAKTQFRNVFEVFQELANKWNDPSIAQGAKDALMAGAQEAGLFAEELANVVGMQEEYSKMTETAAKATENFTDVQKRDAAQAAAGVYRRNYFIGLLEKFATTQEVLISMNEAEGYSMRENERTMGTLEKKVQSLKTSATQLAVAIGEAGLLDSFKNLTDLGKDAIEIFNGMNPVFRDFVINFGVLFTTIEGVKLTSKLFGITESFKGLTTALSATNASFAAFSAKAGAFMATWGGPIALGLMATGAIILTTANHIKKLREEKQKLLEGAEEDKAEIESLETMVKKYEELSTKAKDNNEAKEELLSLQKQLAEIYPEYVDGISDEGDKLVTNIELLKEQNRLKKEELELKIQEQIDKSPKELSDLLKRKEMLEGMLEQAKSLKEHGVPDILGFDKDKDIQDIIGKLQAVNYQIALLGSFLNKQEDDYDKVEKARLKAIGALNTETDATNANTDAKAGNLVLTEEQKEAEEAFVKAFNEHISNMQTYKGMLDEINSKEGLSNKSKQDIISKYQQFIPYLSDEKSLREQLAKAIDDEDKAQKKLYLSKVENEETFYTTMLTNNKTLVDKLEEGYNVDLSNYKNLAEAKRQIDILWLQEASERWYRFYDITTDTLQGLSGTIGVGQSVELSKLSVAVDKIRAFNKEMNSIALKGTDFKSGLSTKKISGGTDSTGISANEALERVSRYLELEQAIDKVSLALARNKALQENTDDANKLNTLKQEEIELYKQMQQALHELNEERRKEKDELKGTLSKTFKFDGDTLLDYKATMDKKLAEVNKHANDKDKATYNRLKADYKDLETAAKRYFDLVLKEIPKASEEWWKYEKTISNVNESITKSFEDAEKEAYDLMKQLVQKEKDIDEKKLKQKEERLKADLEELERTIYFVSEKEYNKLQDDKVKALEKQISLTEKRLSRKQNDITLQQKLVALQSELTFEQSQTYDSLVSFRDVYEELANIRIQALQDEIDALEKEDALQKEIEEREKRKLEIQELQLKLQNLQEQKTIQHYKEIEDGVWDYVYTVDQEAIDKTQKEIKDKQESLDKWERDNTLKQKREQLQNQIKHEQDILRTKQNSYDKQKKAQEYALKIERDNFNKFYDDMDIIVEDRMGQLKTTSDNKWDEILSSIAEKLAEAQSMYRALLDLQAKASAISIGGSSSSGYLGGSSKTGAKGPSYSASGTQVSKDEIIKGLSDAYAKARSAGDWRGMEQANREANKVRGLGDVVTAGKDIEYIKKGGFKEGGPVDFTGLTMVHGSKASAETMFNAADSKKLYDFVHSSKLDDLAQEISSFRVMLNIPNINTGLARREQVQSNSKVEQHYHISKMVFPNVTDGQEVVDCINGLPTVVLQHVKRG